MQPENARILSLPDQFLEPLDTRFVDGRLWMVLHDFEYRLKENTPEADKVIVPAGFLTDFASVPRGLWNLLPPTGPYGPAAVLHDYLYRYRNIVRPHLDRDVCGHVIGLEGLPCSDHTDEVKPYLEYLPPCTRKQADQVLLEAMTVLGVNVATRQAVYWGVRIGGWHAWNGYRSGAKETE